MPKRTLDAVVATKDTITRVSLNGSRAEERYADDELAVLGDMPELEWCHFQRQALTRIPPGLTTLGKLRLVSFLDVATLASLEGIEQLVSLQELWLRDVPGLDLERTCELLAELPELTKLRLGGAAFRRMPRGIRKLHSLLEISLDDCPQLDVADAFVELGKVESLRNLALIQRRPRTLLVPEDAFAPLSQVCSLQLFEFSTLPSSVGSMTNLRKLELERNRFKTLPATLGKLAQLEELDVSSSKLTALPDELCDCAALEVLNVSGNPLKTLPARIGALGKLRRLDAHRTKLKALPASFGELASLRHLKVSSEKLSVPESFYQLELVEFIGPGDVRARLTLRPPETPDADRVCLYEDDRLPDDFGDPRELELHLHARVEPISQLSQLRRLIHLTIDTGNLGDAFARLASASQLAKLTIVGEHPTLPPTLGDLVQLEVLTIDTRPIGSHHGTGVLAALPVELGKLVGLVELHLEDHQMTTLPAAIGELAALEVLDLAPGKLTHLPAAIGKLERLTSLYLRAPGNLERLPDELAQCRALANVGITGWHGTECHLANLELLGALPALRTLSLTRVRLPVAKVIAALAGGPLQHLDLRDTRLTELPAEIGGLSQLTTLNLDGTDLTHLPPELRACERLREITLSIYKLDRAVVDKIKDHLPKGRWKKMHRSHRTWYERTDLTA